MFEHFSLLKIPTFTGNAWRGDVDHVSQHYTKDQNVFWGAFSSSSTSADVTNKQLTDKGTFFLIEIINGKNLHGYTKHNHEKEVILFPGSNLRVLNQYNTRNGIHMIQLRQLNPDEISSATPKITKVIRAPPRPHSIQRISNAKCRGQYAVEENKHYCRGIGGGGIYLLCECNM